MLNHKNYKGVPNRTLNSIDRWVIHGIAPGHFLTAVLTNNLREACAYADRENKAALCRIVQYCHNEIPSNCWGTKEIFKNYEGNKDFEVYKERNE